jgi:DNA-binding transcriptional MocR family regulator
MVAIARRHDLLVIEDASYAYLAGESPPPLAALAPELTVYVSGLSKSVATGLRVGFVAAPTPVVPAIERAIRATTWNTPAITTAIACRWLEDGTVSRLEADKRDDAGTRQSIARDVLACLPLMSHPSSYFAWLPLPEGARADRIAASLSREHISVSTAEPFTTSAHAPQEIRLALGSADLHSLRVALSKVRQVVEADPYR